MRRPSVDLAEPSRNLEESVGAPAPDSFDPETSDSLALETDFTQTLDLHEDGGGPQSLPRAFTPPPHLAARFYRPSQNRRKDSAASSRRNSVCSVPSLSSSHGAAQLHSGPQSKHIANHQRRDAILKDRQKRLADRAAHVEKVRLRAARAKERTISLSEERAIAAKEARERNLNQIAAACAEEVKRAKAIAESTKGKRELELQKMRQQMEERQAEAERRREELRRQPQRARGSSLDSKKSVEALSPVGEVSTPEPRPLAEDAAVCRLQTWWRATTKRQAVNAFSQLGLTLDEFRDKHYDAATELIQDQRVMLATARILAICGLEKGKPDSVAQMGTVRLFLSAFLILGHPSQVLSNTYDLGEQDQGSSSSSSSASSASSPLRPRDDLANPLVQELVGKAKDLLITFENIVSRLTSLNNYTVPPSLADALPTAHACFERAFLNWQTRDKSALIDGMLKQLVELDALIDHVKETSVPAAVEEYKEAVAPNQQMFVVRIKKVLGPEKGLRVIRQALFQARKERAAKKKQRTDMRPRAAEESMTAESVMAELTPGEQQTTATITARQSVARPVGASAGTSPTSSSRSSVPQMAPQANLLPDNRVVMHELAINKEYRTSAQDFVDAESKALKPYLDGMRATMNGDALSREIHFCQLINVAAHIQQKLLRLVHPSNPLHSVVMDLLDIEQFKQTFRNGSFSYENFFSSMANLLPKLCAPVRDEQVKDLAENKLVQGSYVERLEALILFIDVMLSDFANLLLHMATPRLLRSAAQYEAKAFANAIHRGEHGLFAAETAWRAARSKVMVETARRDSENTTSQPKNRPTADKIYSHMLVGIFTQTSHIRYGQIPEMLQLDFKRIHKYGDLTRNMITAGGILLQCKNLLKRDVRAPWKTEATRIMTVLDTAESEEAAVNGVMAALEAGRSMPPAVKTHLRGFVQNLIAAHWQMVSATQPEANTTWDPTGHDPNQPVLRLLLKRLRDHLVAHLTAGSRKATNAAGEKLASSGLGEFMDRVRGMTDEMTKVGAVDREAHRPWWEQVAEKIESENAGGD
ncbi:hypothetical protein M406DRAFT_339442 [Cryphonectria parasitica EP155]|uniref:IQ calmodulin-binding motif domain protein n=1 Tax=Cryphonectria parasitica (strain ATCC 38755 / EP155) TaxID=660469 RepID=A0A9P4Y4E7_CRYP1|nr:uncharacterized protein M406DRAFT_339442 [Cryphonectria parasitica EP155]KAF3766167.1 hypothetical protein M406DRAFT_339442 [Cryphonectria parasitica EP155]